MIEWKYLVILATLIDLLIQLTNYMQCKLALVLEFFSHLILIFDKIIRQSIFPYVFLFGKIIGIRAVSKPEFLRELLKIGKVYFLVHILKKIILS